MKKQYLTPEMTVYNVVSHGLVATSNMGLNDGSVGEDEVLSREDKPVTPNLWEQGW